jgi:sedoheptulose-bisphosphatase
MGIYGPRTVFCLAVKGYPGCHEFLLMDDGKWVHVKETTGAGSRAAAGVSVQFVCTCTV